MTRSIVDTFLAQTVRRPHLEGHQVVRAVLEFGVGDHVSARIVDGLALEWLHGHADQARGQRSGAAHAMQASLGNAIACGASAGGILDYRGDEAYAKFIARGTIPVGSGASAGTTSTTTTGASLPLGCQSGTDHRQMCLFSPRTLCGSQ